MSSPNGPALRAAPRSTPVVALQGQLREHELGEAVGLLQVRVAGEDEAVDAEPDVFRHALGDLVRVADQRRAGAAAHEADAGPEVGADLELVAPAAVQRAPCGSGRRNRSARRPPAPRRWWRRRAGEMSVVGGAPRPPPSVSRTITCRRMPKREGRARARAARARHAGDLLGDVGRGLAPGQVDVDMVGRDLDAGLRRAAEIERRIGRLHRREEDAALLDPQVLALEGDRLARASAPRQMCRNSSVTRVALVVLEEDAVAARARPGRRRSRR